MSANPDSVGNQGEFQSRVPPAQPMTKSGHQLGQQVGNEAVPESRAKTFPPGTAPKEHSYQPNPVSQPPGQALNSEMDPSLRTGALDMPGATSKDVHNTTDLGGPMQGQTSRELHGAHGTATRKKERGGVEGAGATASTMDDTVEDRARQLVADLTEGVERGVRGTAKGPAEEMYPESATEVAAETGPRRRQG